MKERFITALAHTTQLDISSCREMPPTKISSAKQTDGRLDMTTSFQYITFYQRWYYVIKHRSINLNLKQATAEQIVKINRVSTIRSRALLQLIVLLLWLLISAQNGISSPGT